MKPFSSGFDECRSYRSLLNAASVTLAVVCKAKTLIPIADRTWAGVFAEIELISLWCKRVSNIHEIHPNFSTFSLTQKITRISKCCYTCPNKMHGENRVYRQEKQTVFPANSRTLLVTALKISLSCVCQHPQETWPQIQQQCCKICEVLWSRLAQWLMCSEGKIQLGFKD